MSLTLTPQQARTEAERCLQCFDAPCEQACPTHIRIPTFIGMIRSDNILGAAEVVKTANALINVCGKICPEETFCQSVCTRSKQD
jgi:NADPH-dependent glutamate synthase beta subunit-like oxidoreductase